MENNIFFWKNQLFRFWFQRISSSFLKNMAVEFSRKNVTFLNVFWISSKLSDLAHKTFLPFSSIFESHRSETHVSNFAKMQVMVDFSSKWRKKATYIRYRLYQRLHICQRKIDFQPYLLSEQIHFLQSQPVVSSHGSKSFNLV